MREIYFDDHINDSEYSGKLLRSRTDVYSIKRARGSGAGGGGEELGKGTIGGQCKILKMKRLGPPAPGGNSP